MKPARTGRSSAVGADGSRRDAEWIHGSAPRRDYGGRVSRTAWTLAALADAAVSGVHPTRVEELVDRVGERFRVGFVEDTEGRRWVVRVPVDAVAAAQLEESGALTELLAGHVPFGVPRPAGAASLRDGRRAVVTALIPGRCIDFAALLPGPGLTAHVARAIAAIHNVDRRLFEEAGVPAYEADDCRRRRQADVDRGAATGLVPTGLLARWERMLDDVSWWRFAPTPVHGRLQEDHLLLAFEDESDSSSGRIVGITSWENAQIADPAQDLAALLALCPVESTDTVIEAYAAARHELPDPHLTQRASLLAELEYLSELLTARRVGDRTHLAQATQALRRLDDLVSAEQRSGNRSGTSIDRLPVDFEPAPVGQDWYSAGSPAGSAAPDTQTVYRAGDPAAPGSRSPSAPAPSSAEGTPQARSDAGQHGDAQDERPHDSPVAWPEPSDATTGPVDIVREPDRVRESDSARDSDGPRESDDRRESDLVSEPPASSAAGSAARSSASTTGSGTPAPSMASPGTDDVSLSAPVPDSEVDVAPDAESDSTGGAPDWTAESPHSTGGASRTEPPVAADSGVESASDRAGARAGRAAADAAESSSS